jgi:uncharacterized UBP type Zn finger protein
MNNTKYKFVETTGCTAFNFTVNDRSFSELSEQEYDEMLSYLFEKIKEGISEQTILLQNVIQLFQYDDYEHDPNQCEQCGDYISSVTWNI